MINKRFLAFTIDLIVAIIPAIISIFVRFKTFDLDLLIYSFLILYISHTSMMILITKKHTLGELFLKISCVSLGNKTIKVSRLFFRNLVFSFLLSVVLLNLDYSFDFYLIFFLFIGMNLVVFSKNIFQKEMTVIDFLFNTYYAEVSDKD